ncbi:hypothetical protein NC661_02670 [Aquibacillus koreensis]|uniref:Uncharacterized protein n=1 Tax=Aquibacillus koreensis TaxID=279446 RepID=A0A9X3WGE0_9BACI|nr:hypothetical protein [Aquibacillus koreensis]MCT2534995.1 hypothetical protein [Aquibacillus koreensis]MDC3419282.1 hypothetical protein [Aquibacillus koreensis]
MKKWIVVTFGAASLVVWFAVIWIFLGIEHRAEQNTGKLHDSSQKTLSIPLMENYKRFDEPVGQEIADEIDSNETMESTSVSKTQKALHELSVDNEVSIDDLLTALGIEY